MILSFSLNGFIKGGVSSLLVSNPVSVKMFDEIGIDSEKIQVFAKGEEVQEFVNGYIEPVIDGSIDVDSVDIGTDILMFINDNKEKIEEVIGHPLPMEKIETYTQGEEIEKINDSYKELVSEVSNNVPVEIKNSISVFRYFLSNEFRLIIMGICLVSLIVIAVVQGSFYIWIRTLGNMLVWCGVLVLSGSLIISMILNIIDTSVELDLSSGFYSSFIAIGGGILCLIIYIIMKKNINNKEKLNEISEVSE